ncbi:MAG TPA: zinc-dependent dehydrogenase [bacterium]
MRVAMYYKNRDVRLEEMPVPVIGKGEILLRVDASGICGSDVMEWYRIHKAPLVLGHEVAGVVAEVGEEVTGCKAGDRVAVAHHVPCNTCHYCMRGHHTVCDTLRTTNFDPGGFSEFIRVPSINVHSGIFHIPDNVSSEDATFAEPLACVIRGQRLAGIQKGDTALILGSGISGLLHVKSLRFSGAGRIFATDMDDYRLEAAEHFGADKAINAKEYSPDLLKKLNNNRLADIVIVCATSSSAAEQAVSSVERGGTVLFFAPLNYDQVLPIQFNALFWRNEVTLTSSYGGSPADYAMAMAMLGSGKITVNDMISHRFGLAEAGKGFQLVADAGKSLKVVVEPQK